MVVLQNIVGAQLRHYWQAVYYVCLGLWVAGFDLLAGNPRSLDQMFSYTELQANHNGGKLLIAAFVCNALNW